MNIIRVPVSDLHLTYMELVALNGGELSFDSKI